MGALHNLVARVIQVGMGRLKVPASLRVLGADLPAPTTIEVPTPEGPVRVHVYRPAGSATAPPPVYVNFHGGGFVARNPEGDDHICRALAAGAGCVVLNVDYDVAPQRPFPVAPRQAYAVAAWAAGAGAEQGWDGGRLAVGGQSAGGNLAAGICLTARDTGDITPLLQVMLYPPMDIVTPAARKYARTDKPLISPRIANIFDNVYVPDPARRVDPLVSPLHVDDLTGLPAALVVTAEYDLLRDEGDAYAARLAEAGVPVEHHVIPGVDHAFTHVEPAAPALRAIDLVVEAVAKAFAPA